LAFCQGTVEGAPVPRVGTGVGCGGVVTALGAV